MKILAIALNTFREAIRNRMLFSVVLFAALLVGMSALFGAVTIGSQARVIKDFGLFSLSFFGSLIAIISGVSLLDKEIRQRTVYNILSKPVNRWEYVMGKHLGIAGSAGVMVMLMGLSLIVFSALFEGRVDFLLIEGIFFAVLEVALVSAVTVFFSSLVITTTLSGLFTLAFYIAGKSINYLQYFMIRSDDYNPVIPFFAKLVEWILPDLSLFNFSNQLVYGQSATTLQFLYAILYCLSYSLIALLLATLFYNRREFT